MRELADAERIAAFMSALGESADVDGACYLTGGATAVLVGWRASTIDVDIRLVPETERLLSGLQRLKEEIRINIELASRIDFIPVTPGWEDRSVFIVREGRLRFYHFDLYAQSLAKLERAHARDLDDVTAMVERQLIEPAHALPYFGEIEHELYRYPAIDPRAFRRRVEDAFGGR